MTNASAPARGTRIHGLRVLDEHYCKHQDPKRRPVPDHAHVEENKGKLYKIKSMSSKLQLYSGLLGKRKRCHGGYTHNKFTIVLASVKCAPITTHKRARAFIRGGSMLLLVLHGQHVTWMLEC